MKNGGTPYFSVVINNYNYARFVGEAIDSVLAQECGDLQLIVVDDGSTDGSADVIGARRDERMETVFKENGGQLSCFNAALPLIRGEATCFLDADDVFEPQYLATLRHVYDNDPFEYVFCNMRYFGERKGLLHGETERVVIADSYCLARYTNKLVSGPTSSISMRTGLLRRILPLPDLEADWRLCGDLVLSLGADLQRAVKCYIPEIMVGYRQHGANADRQQRDGAEGEERKRREGAAAVRYQSRFPGAGVTRDFGKIVGEMLASPIPLAYKGLLGKRLWVFGRVLCKIAALTKRRTRLKSL